MYPAKFDYYRAGSVAEAVALLQQLGPHHLVSDRRQRTDQEDAVQQFVLQAVVGKLTEGVDRPFLEIQRY